MPLPRAILLVALCILFAGSSFAACPSSLASGVFCTANNPNLAAGTPLQAGFYVSNPQSSQSLCATSTSSYPSYPTGYCLPTPYQMVVSTFKVTVVYTGSSCTSAATTGLTASMSGSNTYTAAAGAPSGSATCPSSTQTAGNFVTTTGATVPSLAGCTYSYTSIAFAFSSNDQAAKNPLSLWVHVSTNGASAAYYVAQGTVTAGSYFAPTAPSPTPTPTPAPTPSPSSSCPTSFPAPVTDYANYPINQPVVFIPASCSAAGYDGTNALLGVTSCVMRAGTTTWDCSQGGNMPGYGNIYPGDQLKVSWTGSVTACPCFPVAISIKKCDVNTFVGTDNQALIPGTMNWAYANPGVAGSVVTTMPSRAISCNYQVDTTVGPPLTIIGPGGSYYHSSTRQSYGKNGGPTMLIGSCSNNGGDGTCSRLFVPAKWWQSGSSGTPTQIAPSNIPSNWALTMKSPSDGTSGSCSYSGGSLVCTYNNNGKTSATNGMYVNIGNDNKFTISESSWSLSTQVAGPDAAGNFYAPPGAQIGGAEVFTSCSGTTDAASICTINVLNQVTPVCATGGPSCGCAGACVTSQMTSAASPVSNVVVSTWTFTNPASCAAAVQSIVWCSSTSLSYVAAQSSFTVGATYSDPFSGCKIAVATYSAGFFPCNGIQFTPAAGCVSSGKSFALPIATVTPPAGATWTFYSQSVGGTNPNLAIVATDSTCPVPPPPPTTTTTTTPTTTTTTMPTSTTTTRPGAPPTPSTTTTTTTTIGPTLPPPTTVNTRPTTTTTTTTTMPSTTTTTTTTAAATSTPTPAPTTPVPTQSTLTVPGQTTVATTTTSSTTTTSTTTAPAPTTTSTTTRPFTTVSTLPETFAPIPATTGAISSGGQCAKQGFAAPNCNTCVDLSNIGFVSLCVPVTGTSNPVVYNYVAQDQSLPVPTGSYVPGAWDDNGYLLNCDCTDKIFACAGGCTTDPNFCVCDGGYGQCVQDPSCNVQTTAPPTTQPGQTCAQCPMDYLNQTCSAKGFCNCGICQCGSVTGYQYSGTNCEIATPVCQSFTDCASCNTASACQWCSSACVTSTATGSCGDGTFASVSCTASAAFVAAVCPNNCTNPSRGVCGVDPVTNATVCLCTGSAHGADCSLDGGINIGAVAGGIAGGVIAAIVIVGAIILGVVVIGTKKAVDWAMLNNISLAQANTNPTFVDPSMDHVNASYTGNSTQRG